MAEVLTIDSDDGDDNDIQILRTPRRRIARKANTNSPRVGTRSSPRQTTRHRTLVEEITVSGPSSPARSDCSTSMDSPAAPTRKLARTRRGIARRGSDDSEPSILEMPVEIPIYTSQIYVLREKKRLLDSERDKSPLFIEDVDAENVCPQLDSRSEAVKTRGRGRPCKKKPEEPTVIPVLSVSNDSDPDDEVLLSPPPPTVLATKRRKTKKQKEQDALLKSIQAAQDRFEAAKRYEKQDNFCELTGLDTDVLILEEDADKEIQMKFRFRNKITRIPMKMSQRFHKILPELSELCSAPAKEILLTIRDTIIKPEDTPTSLRLTIADIIECGLVILSTQPSKAEEPEEAAETDPNVIRLQLQSKDQRNKVTVTIRKSELLSSVMEQYAEKTGVPLDKLTFKFDGETIGPEDTPDDLDLEDDFCIDVIVQT